MEENNYKLLYGECFELYESVELFGIHRQDSHSWAIIDAVWVYGGCRIYIIQP